MDVSPNEAVTAFAARAQEATRNLYRQASGLDGHATIGSAAEISDVLTSLRLLTENIGRSLPELGAWLEKRLCNGDLSPRAFDAVTRSVFDTASALARAQNLAMQLGQELGAAEVASRELIA
ncbi:hypothetical protein LWP59_32510 [Amycolatopsis acidiphila]|uniref:Uncharacterized protein n=1 Tax=Amycolatopsis acidiphila TaxID=715473 RepID=A0A558A6F5_9PSEU|nr:hypothetical protein [Amycolatopsis acidiphila]TVT19859.1 hypothetical protein FNH06_22840 [Amycolatopsis acidiphila]UIJ58769.1 hypothetical protein LWP59_32510 [Amycolatopsis acidiphila]GHG71826.1 hypothetical protein GCM10017788_33840 [Amycolatopsis acidiphila]